MPDAGQESDDDLLDRLAQAAFGYFVSNSNPDNGLVADTSRPGSPCSIAVTGFALTCYLVGVRRGWMQREAAVARTLAVLRFLSNSAQGEQPDVTGYKGFYYHFLDMRTGRRTWQSELSFVDTALLFAGVLSACAFFDQDTKEEREIRESGDRLYRRIDWQWARGASTTIRQGWKPEGGFLNSGWDGYDEAIILYVLALGSPTYNLAARSFAQWTATYQWENIYGYDFLYAGPLFIHQFSHTWIDFAGIKDRFMREKRSDYFENSKRATYVQREYARRNPDGFAGCGKDFWGITASDGPGKGSLVIGGRERNFASYAARGVPFGPDDGTINPCGMLACVPFAPELVLPAMRQLAAAYPDILDQDRLPSGFNPTARVNGDRAWVSEGYFGLDQGIVVLMIENYRSGLIWHLMRRSAPIRLGLRRAGFTGGWLG
jgi:hypothetical protein